MDKPRTLFVLSHKPNGVSQWRTYWPCATLKKHGYVAEHITIDQFDDAIVRDLFDGKYTAIVTPRMAIESSSMQQAWLSMLLELKSKQPVKVFYELDDDIFSQEYIDTIIYFLTESNQLDQIVRFKRQRESRLQLLEHVDGVITVNNTIADLVKSATEAQISVVHNGIDAHWFSDQVQAHPRTLPGLTIGWAGGQRLEAELEPAYTVWPQIAHEFPGVYFIIQGWCPARLTQTMPAHQLIVQPMTTLDDYPSALANIDIYCDFASKPWSIKWYEATLAGAACVMSPNTYGQATTHNATALIAASPEEWYTAVRQLILDTLLRRRIQATAQHLVLSRYTMEHTYTEWLDALGT